MKTRVFYTTKPHIHLTYAQYAIRSESRIEIRKLGYVNNEEYYNTYNGLQICFGWFESNVSHPVGPADRSVGRSPAGGRAGGQASIHPRPPANNRPPHPRLLLDMEQHENIHVAEELPTYRCRELRVRPLGYGGIKPENNRETWSQKVNGELRVGSCLLKQQQQRSRVPSAVRADEDLRV